jgi:TetR/AcrR family transcriptional regulator
MAEVARHAGLSKASLFHHFPSKEALYREALQQTITDLGELIEQARLDEGSYRVRLDRLGRLVVRYLGNHENAGKLLLREMLDRGPFFDQGGDFIVQTVLVAIADFLQAGMDAGAFAPQDPRQLALSITGLHLFYFGAADIAGEFVGSDLHDAQTLAAREEAMLQQIQRLCLRRRPSR